MLDKFVLGLWSIVLCGCVEPPFETLKYHRANFCPEKLEMSFRMRPAFYKVAHMRQSFTTITLEIRVVVQNKKKRSGGKALVSVLVRPA